MLFLGRKYSRHLLVLANSSPLLSDHPALSSNSIIVDKWKWIWHDAPPDGIDAEGFRGRVQYRHRMMDVAGAIQRSVQPIWCPFISWLTITAVWVTDGCASRSRSRRAVSQLDKLPQCGIAIGVLAAVSSLERSDDNAASKTEPYDSSL